MSTKFLYALILTICGAVFSLLMYFTGFQTEKLATGQQLQWIMLICHGVVLWLGIKAVREENEGKYLSYGQGVGAGTLISLFSGLMSGAYTYIHFKFINPSFFEYQASFMREQWAAKGLSDAQIERASAMMEKFSGPGIYACIAPVMAVIFGLILSLIISAILKRPPPPEMAA